MERVSELQIREAIANFNYTGRLKDRRPFGIGHINDTFLLTFEIGDMGDMNVILQRMNREIFTKPVELMEKVMTGWKSRRTFMRARSPLEISRGSLRITRQIHSTRPSRASMIPGRGLSLNWWQIWRKSGIR